MIHLWSTKTAPTWRRQALLEGHKTMGSILSPAFSALQRAYDNRAEPEQDDADDTDPVHASDEAMALAGRADRAFQAGDRAAAADLYRSAAELLLSAAEVCEVKA
jgi:hypothetical protein